MTKKQYLASLCDYIKKSTPKNRKYVPVQQLKSMCNERQWNIMRKALWFLMQRNCLEYITRKDQYYVRVAEKYQHLF